MFKKLSGSLLITMLFLFLGFSSTAFAAPVISVNGTEYETVKSAFTEAAKLTDESIEMKLLENCSYSGAITTPLTAKFNGSLDLNGKNLTISNSYITIPKDKIFTIKSSDPENGKLIGSIRYPVNVSSGGTLILDSGTITDVSTNTLPVLSITKGAKIIINGGAIIGTSKSAYTISCAGDLEINNGTVQGTTYGILMQPNGVLTLNNGEISGLESGIRFNKNGTAYIKGGKVLSTNETDNTSNNAIVMDSGGKLYVSGGEITGPNCSGIAIFGKGELEMSGGKVIGTGNAAIATNGTHDGSNDYSGSVIKISGGFIQGTTGMYLPSYDGITEITGGTITGNTGIEIRAGRLLINGNNTKIIGTYSPFKAPDNGNLSGGTVVGAALAVSQHTTEDDIHVIINGGQFTGDKTIAFEALQSNDYFAENSEFIINDGIFNGNIEVGNNKTGQPVTINNTDPVESFVYGGIFSEKVDPDYINETVDFVIPTSSSSDNTKKYYGYASSEKVDEIKNEFAQIENYEPSKALEAFEVVKGGKQDITSPYYFIQFDLGSGGTLTTSTYNLNKVGDGLYNGTIQPDEINGPLGKYDFKTLFDDLTFNRVGYEGIVEWTILNPEENSPLTQSELTATSQKINTDGVTKLIATWKPVALISASLIVDKGTMDSGSMGDLNTIINIEPSDAPVIISFSSSDSEVASVNETGILEAKKAGTAVITITITPEDGEPVTLTYTLTVNDPNSKPSDSNKPTKPGESTPSYPSSPSTPNTPNQPKTAEIKVTQDNPSYGEVSGNKTYNVGDKATLSATPAKGYRFVGWSENDQIVSKDNPYTFIVENDKELKAIFEKIEPENTEPEEVAVYRIYNPTSGEHVYTTHKEEVTTRIKEGNWNYEDIAWYSPTSGVPVYRLYNPTLGTHLYTTDTNEINVLTNSEGWISDFNGSPLFYSGGTISVYRLYNEPLHGEHLLTTDTNEYQQLPSIAQEWQQEGTSFNVIRKGK